MQSRTDRLMPAGVPRYVRCYDSGVGVYADRYTVVFTGRYQHRTNGGYMYLGMSAVPFHPQGIGQHGDSSNGPIDRPQFSHLGKRISFIDLPEDCRKCALQTYKAIWELP